MENLVTKTFHSKSKLAVLSFLGVLATSNSVYAMDATTLAGYCKSDIGGAGNYIMGYLDKYRDDVMIVGGILAPEAGSSSSAAASFDMASQMIGKICFPDNANVAMAIKLGCDWLVANPDNSDRSASFALTQAYSKIWPCKK